MAAGTAFAAEPAGPAPKASNGMYVTAKGMTLYTFDKDTAGKSACNGKCAENWPPAARLRRRQADGRLDPRHARRRAEAVGLNGKPVYAFVKDTKPGDKAGDGFMNGAWHVAKQ